MRFGVCMTCISGVCWPCSDTQPSTMLRIDDISHIISATSPGTASSILLTNQFHSFPISQKDTHRFLINRIIII